MEFDLSKIEALSGGLTKAELNCEALLSLGGDMYYDGLRIPQPTAGSFILLEIMGNNFVKGGEITNFDIDVALFILMKKQKALGAVLEHTQFGESIVGYIDEFIASFEVYNRQIIKVFLYTYFKNTSNGFDMLPCCTLDNEPSTKKLVFDADWLISYVSICHKVTGYDMDKIVWELSMVNGGFCMAEYAKEQGQKNVERKQDWIAMLDEIKKQAEQKSGDE